MHRKLPRARPEPIGPPDHRPAAHKKFRPEKAVREVFGHDRRQVIRTELSPMAAQSRELARRKLAYVDDRRDRTCGRAELLQLMAPKIGRQAARAERGNQLLDPSLRPRGVVKPG